jgi:hypothetical protein
VHLYLRDHALCNSTNVSTTFTYVLSHLYVLLFTGVCKGSRFWFYNLKLVHLFICTNCWIQNLKKFIYFFKKMAFKHESVSHLWNWKNIFLWNVTKLHMVNCYRWKKKSTPAKTILGEKKPRNPFIVFINWIRFFSLQSKFWALLNYISPPNAESVTIEH